MPVPLNIISQMAEMAKASDQSSLLRDLGEHIANEVKSLRNGSQLEIIGNDFLTIPYCDFLKSEPESKSFAPLYSIPLKTGKLCLLDFLRENKYITSQKIKLYVDNIVKETISPASKKQTNVIITSDLLNGRITTTCDVHKAYSYSLPYQILFGAMRKLNMGVPKSHNLFVKEYKLKTQSDAIENMLFEHEDISSTDSAILEILRRAIQDNELNDLKNDDEKYNALSLMYFCSYALISTPRPDLLQFSLSKEYFIEFSSRRTNIDALDLLIENGNLTNFYKSWQSTLNLFTDSPITTTKCASFLLSNFKDVVVVSMSQDLSSEKLRRLNTKEIQSYIENKKKILLDMISWADVDAENILPKNSLKSLQNNYNNAIDLIPNAIESCTTPLAEIASKLDLIEDYASAAKETVYSSFNDISTLNNKIIELVKTGEPELIADMASNISTLKNTNVSTIADATTKINPIAKKIRNLLSPTTNNNATKVEQLVQEDENKDLIQELTSEIDSLNRKIQDLEITNENAQQKVTALTQEKFSIEKRYCDLAVNNNSEQKSLIKHLIEDRCTVLDVVMIIKDVFPSVIWGDNIEKLVATSDYGNPKKLLKYLSILCGEYLNSINSGVPDSQSKELLGSVYSANESESVMGAPKFISRRYHLVGEKKTLFTKHLTLGTAHNSKSTIQVYFEIENKVLTIGYIGEHLPLPTK
ncbi:hypothetical protein [Photobacterium kishitanii]|uniref:Uncharacterized protein n=1 Tax=Photobacterium kishitanii TaxID=318456 RepID=A0A2T3KM42_9GAMM|nr:hypothetical protein [Photobacterium kishitanii]PSV00866.1 hypothetical protein C9J27_02235 [Photobacterium kishitanii]